MFYDQELEELYALPAAPEPVTELLSDKARAVLPKVELAHSALDWALAEARNHGDPEDMRLRFQLMLAELRCIEEELRGGMWR